MTNLSIAELWELLEGAGYSDIEALEDADKGWFAVKCSLCSRTVSGALHDFIAGTVVVRTDTVVEEASSKGSAG